MDASAAHEHPPPPHPLMTLRSRSLEDIKEADGGAACSHVSPVLSSECSLQTIPNARARARAPATCRHYLHLT